MLCKLPQHQRQLWSGLYHDFALTTGQYLDISLWSGQYVIYNPVIFFDLRCQSGILLYNNIFPYVIYINQNVIMVIVVINQHGQSVGTKFVVQVMIQHLI